MMYSLRDSLFQVPAMLIAVIFFVMIYSLNWLGYKFKERISRLHPDKDFSIGTAEGSLLGLMALLLAFSFGTASTKFESRRQAIIDEANFINDAILRCDLYPDSIKQSLLPDFKHYVEARIQYFEAGDNPRKVKVSLDDSRKYLDLIWKKTAVLQVNKEMYSRAEKLIPVLISMNNIMTIREAGRVAAVPTLVILVLLMLVFVAGFLTGFGTKLGHRNAMLSMAFAFMTSAVLYLVMELSRPRQGYVNLTNAQERIVDLRRFFD